MNTIILADSYPLFSLGLRAIFEANHFVTIECRSAEDAFNHLAHDAGNSVALVDRELLSIAVETRSISLDDIPPRTVCLANGNELLPSAYLRRLAGVLYRSCSRTELLACAAATTEGKRWVPSITAPSPFTRLNEKELRIVVLIGEGCGNKEIAAAIGTHSEQVVKNRVRMIYDKMGISSRQALVGILRRNAPVTNYLRLRFTARPLTQADPLRLPSLTGTRCTA